VYNDNGGRRRDVPVTGDRTSAGNPARTLALLWRDPSAVPRRGPRRALEIDAIVAAAVALADEHGLAALTMRKVAERVGAGAMSLYTYVADRDELLDLMLDAVYAQMPRTDVADPADPSWRARVTAVAEENRAMYRAHPWAAEISTLRPPLGPGQTAKYEHELAAFDGCGLDDVTVDDCLAHVLGFVRANARDAQDARTRPGGGTDEEWWSVAGPLLARVLDADLFPRAVRIGAAAGAAHGSAHDPDHAFDFGLRRVLDGLAVLIDRAG
jgi:AcrR family transcriptional regulator